MDTLADFIIGYFVIWSVLVYDDFSSISKPSVLRNLHTSDMNKYMAWRWLTGLVMQCKSSYLTYSHFDKLYSKNPWKINLYVVI